MALAGTGEDTSFDVNDLEVVIDDVGEGAVPTVWEMTTDRVTAAQTAEGRKKQDLQGSDFKRVLVGAAVRGVTAALGGEFGVTIDIPARAVTFFSVGRKEGHRKIVIPLRGARLQARGGDVILQLCASAPAVLSEEVPQASRKKGQVVYNDNVPDFKGLSADVTKMAVWSLTLATEHPPQGLAETVDAISSADVLSSADWALTRQLQLGEAGTAGKRGAQVPERNLNLRVRNLNLSARKLNSRAR